MCALWGACRGQGAGRGGAAPAPAAAGGMGRGTIIFAILAVVVLLGLGWLVFAMFQTSDTVATAVDARWERSIAIMGQVPVQASAWRDEAPGQRCRPQLSH